MKIPLNLEDNRVQDLIEAFERSRRPARTPASLSLTNWNCCFCEGELPKSEYLKELSWLKPVDLGHHQNQFAEYMDSCLKIGDQRCIQITEVRSGSEFVMMMADGEEPEEHVAMLGRLNEDTLMRHRCFYHTLPFRAGHLVAYKSDRGVFSRGIIVNILRHGVSLFDPDFGASVYLPLSYLRALSPADSRVRFKAFFAELHDLQVADGQDERAKALMTFVATFNLKAVVRSINTVDRVAGVQLFLGTMGDINAELSFTPLFTKTVKPKK